MIPTTMAGAGRVGGVWDYSQGTAAHRRGGGMLGQPVAGEVSGGAMAVVAIVNSGSSKEPEAMHLRRCLAFLEAKWDIQLWAEHINQAADAISRNRVNQLFTCHTQMEERPEEVDAEVLQILVHECQAGRNPDWSRLWRSCSRKE